LAAEEIKSYYTSGGKVMLEFANAAKKWFLELGVKFICIRKLILSLIWMKSGC
jgi:hypothetical protein